MTEHQEQFLAKLIDTPGPSNHEEAVQRLWKDEIARDVDRIDVDPHGNHIAVTNPGAPISIMLAGHSDEVGLIVKYINDNGFVYVAAVGGVDPGMLPSHRVRILSSKTNSVVPGVLGLTSVHLKAKEDQGKLKYSDVWIDIGARKKEEAEKLIAIGDVVVYGEGYQRLAGTYATARCFDNRIGIYVVAEVMKNLAKRRTELAATVYGLSSVQEETGLWAAGYAGYAYEPTLAVAIDVMPSTDSPGISKELHGDTRVSAGAVLERGIRTNKKISRMLIEVAEKHSIPYQVNVENGHTHTDADPISSQRAGIPIGVVSAPTRYLHSACEVLDLNDLDHCVDILTEFVLGLKPDMDFRPGV
jgi:putative aminopeptidase FrvX